MVSLPNRNSLNSICYGCLKLRPRFTDPPPEMPNLDQNPDFSTNTSKQGRRPDIKQDYDVIYLGFQRQIPKLALTAVRSSATTDQQRPIHPVGPWPAHIPPIAEFPVIIYRGRGPQRRSGFAFGGFSNPAIEKRKSAQLAVCL